MRLSYLLKLYLVSFAVFLGIDMIWLTTVAPSFYQEQIGFLLAENPNVAAAGIFYALFVVGLLYFVVLPSLKVKKIALSQVALAGGFFGFVTYATYDLTNYATIADWPLLLVIVDMIWGTILSASVATVSFLIGRRLS